MKELNERWMNLQLFADGGDGGAPAGEGAGTSDGGEDIPSSIPTRARETYRKAVAKHKPAKAPEESTGTANPETAQHMSYADLIKSDEYKDEHKAYMDKAIGDRLKKYKGLEEKQTKTDELLSFIGQKYKLDSSADTFLEDLKSKMEQDDSFYEDYAMEHDISIDEARRISTLERKVAMEDARKRAELMQAEEDRVNAEKMERWNRLQMNAEQTKKRFPNFNLEVELQDERFARLCAVNNDDTTSAYMACHWNEVINSTAQTASEQARIQTANAIASGKSRPVEGGMASNAPAVIEQDFRQMNLAQLRAFAEEQRRLKRR